MTLLRDTGSPAGLILRTRILAVLSVAPWRGRTSNFGPLDAGWVQWFNPELGIIELSLLTETTRPPKWPRGAILVSSASLACRSYVLANTAAMRTSSGSVTHQTDSSHESPQPRYARSWSRTSRGPVITFAVARLLDSDTVYLGGSDFKVYSADLGRRQVRAEGALRARDLRHRRRAGGDDARLRRLRRQAHLVRHHDRRSDPPDRCSLEVDSQGRLLTGRQARSPAWPTTWSAASGMRKRANSSTNSAGTRSKRRTTSARCSTPDLLADGKLLATGDKVAHVVVWDVKTGHRIGRAKAPVMYTWDKVQRLHSIGGVRSLAFSPDGKQLAVGGTGKIGNIDHLEAKSRIEVFDWKAGKPDCRVRQRQTGDREPAGVVAVRVVAAWRGRSGRGVPALLRRGRPRRPCGRKSCRCTPTTSTSPTTAANSSASATTGSRDTHWANASAHPDNGAAFVARSF